MKQTLPLVPLLTLVACATTPAPQESASVTPSSPKSSGALLLVASAKEQAAACDAAIAQAQRRIDELKAGGPQQPVAAALTAYDDALALLANAGGAASVAENSHPDQAVREAAQACGQQVQQASTAIALDRGVYDALSALDLSREDAATQRWVRRSLQSFKRSGVDRDEATRARVRALNDALVKLGQQFGQNIREDVRFIELAPAALEGLPDDYVRAHSPQANGKVKITTDPPDYLPFIIYAKDAGAREQLWRVYRKRGHPRNLEVLSKMLERRHELATLLGYPNWAAYITEDKMIENPEAAGAFIDRMSQVSKSRAEADFQRLLARKRQDDPKARTVHPWDQTYYEDRVKAEEYALDSRAVRGYFEYGAVKQGVLDITSRLFGLRYERAPDVPVWHPDIEAYDVYEKDGDGLFLGRFFLDMHPRENKYKHAAQFDLVSGRRGGRTPEAVLMCNFPRPGAQPALMQHSEVKTFFHEFGHLLHHVLGGRTRWAGISGTRTEMDFVEAPSQLLEEWAWEPAALAGFARHHEKDEPIPAELVAKMKRADEFGKGLWVRQQMFYAATSLRLHTTPPKGLDTTALVKAQQEKYTPFKFADDTYFQLSFGHLDGYSAVYYTYMWSLVIAKDLFSAFEKEGVLSPEPARRYRHNILEAGGSKGAAELVKGFLGRDYAFQAYEDWLKGG